MCLSEAVETLAIVGDCAAGRPRGPCLTGSVVSTALAQSFGLDEKASKDADDLPDADHYTLFN